MSPFTFRKTPLFRFIAYTVLAAFTGMLPAQPSYAQVAIVMPPPGQMMHITNHFEPPQMVGLKVDLKDPFSFNFIMDKGQNPMTDDVKKEEYNKIIKYFLVSLAMPNKDMWVNLSPYESQRIIPEVFAQTEMGRDLLAQDYILKQFTASLMYPENGLGKQFWSKVYAQAQARFGTTDINVNTFNKVWILADNADIYQKNDTAFLVNSHLKVMLEQDYKAIEKNKEMFGSVQAANTDETMDAKTKMASDIVRQVIIPAIEKEVNEGQSFAAVRQVYNAEIMATWFKMTLRDSLLGQAFANRGKVAGQKNNDPQAMEKIYKQYLRAYKKGVFNYIREDATPDGQTIPRKYFSGGLEAPTTQAMHVGTDATMAKNPVFRSTVKRFAQQAMKNKLDLASTYFRALAAGVGLIGFTALNTEAAPAGQAVTQNNTNIVAAAKKSSHSLWAIPVKDDLALKAWKYGKTKLTEGPVNTDGGVVKLGKGIYATGLGLGGTIVAGTVLYPTEAGVDAGIIIGGVVYTGAVEIIGLDHGHWIVKPKLWMIPEKVDFAKTVMNGSWKEITVGSTNTDGGVVKFGKGVYATGLGVGGAIVAGTILYPVEAAIDVPTVIIDGTAYYGVVEIKGLFIDPKTGKKTWLARGATAVGTHEENAGLNILHGLGGVIKGGINAGTFGAAKAVLPKIFTTKYDQLLARVKNLTTNNTTLASSNTVLSVDFDSLTATNASLVQALDSATTALTQFQLHAQPGTNQLDTATAQALARVQAELTQRQVELDDANDNIDFLNWQLDDAYGQIDALNLTVEQKQATIDQLNQLKDSLKAAKQAVGHERDSLQRQLSAVQQQLAKMTQAKTAYELATALAAGISLLLLLGYRYKVSVNRDANRIFRDIRNNHQQAMAAKAAAVSAEAKDLLNAFRVAPYALKPGWEKNKTALLAGNVTAAEVQRIEDFIFGKTGASAALAATATSPSVLARVKIAAKKLQIQSYKARKLIATAKNKKLFDDKIAALTKEIEELGKVAAPATTTPTAPVVSSKVAGQIADLQKQIDAKNPRIKQITDVSLPKAKKDLEEALKNPKTTDAEKKSLQGNIESLQTELEDLKKDQEDLQKQIDKLQPKTPAAPAAPAKPAAPAAPAKSAAPAAPAKPAAPGAPAAPTTPPAAPAKPAAPTTPPVVPAVATSPEVAALQIQLDEVNKLLENNRAVAEDTSSFDQEYIDLITKQKQLELDLEHAKKKAAADQNIAAALKARDEELKKSNNDPSVDQSWKEELAKLQAVRDALNAAPKPAETPKASSTDDLKNKLQNINDQIAALGEDIYGAIKNGAKVDVTNPLISRLTQLQKQRDQLIDQIAAAEKPVATPSPAPGNAAPAPAAPAPASIATEQVNALLSDLDRINKDIAAVEANIRVIKNFNKENPTEAQNRKPQMDEQVGILEGLNTDKIKKIEEAENAVRQLAGQLQVLQQELAKARAANDQEKEESLVGQVKDELVQEANLESRVKREEFVNKALEDSSRLENPADRQDLANLIKKWDKNQDPQVKGEALTEKEHDRLVDLLEQAKAAVAAAPVASEAKPSFNVGDLQSQLKDVQAKLQEQRTGLENANNALQESLKQYELINGIDAKKKFYDERIVPQRPIIASFQTSVTALEGQEAALLDQIAAAERELIPIPKPDLSFNVEVALKELEDLNKSIKAASKVVATHQKAVSALQEAFNTSSVTELEANNHKLQVALSDLKFQEDQARRLNSRKNNLELEIVVNYDNQHNRLIQRQKDILSVNSLIGAGRANLAKFEVNSDAYNAEVKKIQDLVQRLDELQRNGNDLKSLDRLLVKEDQLSLPIIASHLIDNHPEVVKALQILKPSVKKLDNLGGINLSDENLVINIKVDGRGMPLPVQMQNKAMMNINGLTSIIRRISPLTPQNVPALYDLVK